MRLRLDLLPQSEQTRLNSIKIWLRQNPLVMIADKIKFLHLNIVGSYPRLMREYIILKNNPDATQKQFEHFENRLKNTDIDLRFYFEFYDNSKTPSYFATLYEWWQKSPPSCIIGERATSNFSEDNPYFTLESEKLDITVHPSSAYVEPMGNLYFGLNINFDFHKSMDFLFPPNGKEIIYGKQTITHRLWDVIPKDKDSISVKDFLLIIHLIKVIGKALGDGWRLGENDERALAACFVGSLHVSMKPSEEFNNMKKKLNLSIEADQPFDFTSILKESFAAKYHLSLVTSENWCEGFLSEIESKIVKNHDEINSLSTRSNSNFNSDSNSEKSKANSDDGSDFITEDDQDTVIETKALKIKPHRQVKKPVKLEKKVAIRKPIKVELSEAERLEKHKQRIGFLKKNFKITKPNKPDHKKPISIRKTKIVPEQKECFEFSQLAVWEDISYLSYYSSCLLHYITSAFSFGTGSVDRLKSLDHALATIIEKITTKQIVSHNEKCLIRDYVEDILIGNYPLGNKITGIVFIQKWLSDNLSGNVSHVREFIKTFLDHYLNVDFADVKFYNRLKNLLSEDSIGKLHAALQRQEQNKLIPGNEEKYGEWLVQADNLRAEGNKEQNLGPVLTPKLDLAWKYFKYEPEFRKKYYNLFLSRLESTQSWSWFSRPKQADPKIFYKALEAFLGNIRQAEFNKFIKPVSEINSNKIRTSLIDFENIKNLFLKPLVNVLQEGIKLKSKATGMSDRDWRNMFKIRFYVADIEADGLRYFIEMICKNQDNDFNDVYLDYLNADNFLNSINVTIMDFVRWHPNCLAAKKELLTLTGNFKNFHDILYKSAEMLLQVLHDNYNLPGEDLIGFYNLITLVKSIYTASGNLESHKKTLREVINQYSYDQKNNIIITPDFKGKHFQVK